MRTTLLCFLSLFLFSLPTITLEAQNVPDNETPSIGLVLSGGGAKGFAHVGVLKVLEEENIPIDYIGGTSIGSIIGALYAVGYNSDQMDSLITSQNWTNLITDKIPRDELSITEKGNDEQFFLSLPIRKRKGISLPIGVVEGQQVMNILEDLFSPVYKTRDFSHLPTPFLCVATDLLTGNPVVLDTGNLALAVRSSFAIPSYFTPVKYGDYLFVDGGVVNNFPVMDVKKRGADIIIGVDVQSPAPTISEIDDAYAVLNQIISYHSKPYSDTAIANSNIYIKPDISAYNMMSFEAYDTLIAIGYHAADKMRPALRKLRDSINRRAKKRAAVKAIDSVFIKKVEYSGLVRLNKKFMDGNIKIDTASWVTLEDIKSSINLAYGTKFFQSLRWDLVPHKEGAILKISVEEASSRIISFGLHYDSYHLASINIMATFRNWIVDGSKLSFILGLGKNPLVYGNYFVNRGKIPGFGVKATYEAIDVYTYTDGYRSSLQRFQNFNFGLYLKSTFQGNMEMGLGVDILGTDLSDKISNLGPEKINAFFGNVNYFLRLDTRNRPYFASKGSNVNLLSEYIIEIDSLDNSNYYGVFFTRIDWTTIFPLNKRFSLAVGATAGFSAFNPLPIQNRFYWGGLPNQSFKGLVTFLGMEYLEHEGNHTAIVRTALQYDIYKSKHFAQLLINAGNISNNFEDLFIPKDFFYGYGISYGYNSIIGPLSFTIMTSNRDPILGYLNLGFRIE